MSILARKFNSERMLRIAHRWISIGILIPLFITAATGVLLLLRQQIDWVQPPAIVNESFVAESQWATISQVYASVINNPLTRLHGKKEIGSIIYKPSKGIIQLRTKNKQLIQLEGSTAEILSIAPRRTGWLIQLHEGSYWGKGVRYFVFLPAALGLLLLLISGGILIFKYYNRKRVTYRIKKRHI